MSILFIRDVQYLSTARLDWCKIETVEEWKIYFEISADDPISLFFSFYCCSVRFGRCLYISIRMIISQFFVEINLCVSARTSFDAIVQASVETIIKRSKISYRRRRVVILRRINNDTYFKMSFSERKRWPWFHFPWKFSLLNSLLNILSRSSSSFSPFLLFFFSFFIIIVPFQSRQGRQRKREREKLLLREITLLRSKRAWH